MNVAVLGYGSQGASALAYWQKKGDTVTLCDKNEQTQAPEGVSVQLGDDYLSNLGRFDLIIRSPSIHPLAIVAANPDVEDILNNVTTNTNEFIAVSPSKNIIGVTGTKGKGTTSTLITRMLESAGKTVHLGGNIGIPPLEMLKNDIKADDWVVLELANFQLIDLKHSPHIAVCLLVAQEHLDWHTNINEYVEAKQQLFRWQGHEDTAIFYADNALSQQVVSASKGTRIPYFDQPGACIENDMVVIGDQIICPVDEIKLPGKHNWQNVCAAVTAVWQITQDIPAIREAITHFSGLPFRIEKRGEVNGVSFYNDSFATNPSATKAAIEAIKGPKVMIIGGFERGLNLDEFAKLLVNPQSEIRKIVIIGESGARVAESLERLNDRHFYVETSKDMQTIVKTAYEFATPGDSVILSPAFASFDMFKNFEDRGRQYNTAIENL